MTKAERHERVVVVTSSYPAHPDDPSGHFVAAEVRRFRSAGHDVLVLTPCPADRWGPGRTGSSPWSRSYFWGPKTPDREVSGPSGERILRVAAGDAFGWPGAVPRLRERPLRALGGLAFVRGLRRELRVRAPFDRLVSHFLIPCVWPALDGLRPARALEAVLHGSDVRLACRLPALVRRRMARTLEPFDVRCTSEELRGELRAAFGASIADRARVEPAALDLPPRGRAEARRELGIAPSERLLVVAGRLVREKRVDVALRAARLVPNARAVVVGDGPERAALEREFGDASFVGLVGRARALTWIAAADALLVASREEGAPSVVREARALGTPVVALPSGDLRDWQKRDPGLFVVSISPS
jgi:glycosyltransferase involved in cell wall biosynthesis